jgi:hypothetical protein
MRSGDRLQLVIKHKALAARVFGPVADRPGLYVICAFRASFRRRKCFSKARKVENGSGAPGGLLQLCAATAF